MNPVSIQLLYYIAYLLPVFAGIAMLVLGIMVPAGKEPSVRILGIGFILESVAQIFNGSLVQLSRMVSVKSFMSLSVGSSIISSVCTAAGLVCMCIFIHKNYGRKLIYIPVLSINVGGWFINKLVVSLLSKAVIRSNPAAWISMTNTINNFVIHAAVAVILIVVLFKNRKTEKVIPQAWLCKTLALAGSFMGLLFNCVYYLSLVRKMQIRYLYIYSSVIVGAFSLVCIILPLYTAVMVYSKKKEPAQV